MFSEYLVAFILLMLFFYYLKKSMKGLKNVPGPKPNIFFGNLLDAIVPRHKQLSILTGYMKKYGKTIKLQLGPFKEVVLTSDPKLTKFLLSSTKFIEKSQQYKAIEKWLGNSLLTTPAAIWRRQRRMLTPSFHISVLSKYIDIYEKLSEILIKKLEKEVDKDRVDIYPLMSLYTLDVICESAMGTPVNAQMSGQSEFVSILAEVTDLMVARCLIPLPDWLYCFTPMYFFERRKVKAYHSYTEGVIKKRMDSLKNASDDEESFDTHKGLNFLDLLLKTRVDGKPLDRTEIKNQVDGFMFGGQDTTASTLTFLLYSLAHHPEAQKKVYEEQKALFGENDTTAVAIRDLQKMKYLENVIKETLRRHTPAPLIGRKFENELEWDGMIFPKNTDIFVYLHDIHRNPDIFPEPEKFIPERFEEGSDKYQYNFIPFSAGPRNCLGKTFALLEIKTVISKIIRNFKILPSRPEQELHLIPRIVLVPINGCYVSLMKSMFSEFLVAFILLMLFFYYVKKSKKGLKNVPGPKPNVFFGNLLDAIAPQHKQLSILTGYMKKYGKTVKIYLGPFKELVLTSDPKLTKFLLSSSKNIEKPEQYKAFEKWLGNTMITTPAESWRKQRRMLTPSFHLSVLSGYIDVFERMSEILVQKLEKKVDKDKVDIYPLISLFTLDTICESSLGTSVNAQMNGQSEFVSILEQVTDLMVARGLIPLPDWLYCFTPMYFFERRKVKAYHSYTEGVVKKRLESLKNANDDEASFDTYKRLNFLDLLLKTRVDGKPLDKTEINDQVGGLIFAGQDTTASALTFLLYSLAHHPEVQKKAYKEQKALFGENSAPEVTFRDLQEMKYLENVIKETLRLYPSAPLLGRKTEDELEWDGMIFPKNTDIWVFLYHIHRNPEIFPEPEKFIPERFEGGSDKYQYNFIPFSAGPRNCLGKTFALLEMKTVVSKVIRNFEILPSKPEQEMYLIPRIVLVPMNGCYVSLRKR